MNKKIKYVIFEKDIEAYNIIAGFKYLYCLHNNCAAIYPDSFFEGWYLVEFNSNFYKIMEVK